MKRFSRCCPALLGGVQVFTFVFMMAQTVQAAWPTRPVEFTNPAGAGGGADLCARFLIGLNVKGKYISQPIIPV